MKQSIQGTEIVVLIFPCLLKDQLRKCFSCRHLRVVASPIAASLPEFVPAMRLHVTSANYRIRAYSPDSPRGLHLLLLRSDPYNSHDTAPINDLNSGGYPSDLTSLGSDRQLVVSMLFLLVTSE